MSKTLQSLSLLLALTAVALTALACNAYNPDLGDRPFRCGDSEERCPDGYRCVVSSPTQEFCEREGGPTSPDAANNFNCADDSATEPNNELAMAFVTPIPDQSTSFSLVGQAICAADDVDIFRFGIDLDGRNLRTDISFDASQTSLVLEVLNNGTPIRIGGAVSGNPGLVRAEVANMPPGEFFVSVRSDTGLQNNYSIEIEISGP